MKERVVVAMSGGVDSSVAAALLKKDGFEVVGITLCFNLPDTLSKKPSCCGPQGIDDARRVAYRLGIKHYVLNMQKVLEEKVVKDFVQEYLKGRTPNPCIRCNQYIKFRALLKRARSLGAKFLATGHYARIIKTQNSPPQKFAPQKLAHPPTVVAEVGPPRNVAEKLKTQNYLLKKAKDLEKDQSYFLYRLNQNQLKHILFPLGDYTKDEVRTLARRFELPVAEKMASQEICFLPGNDYRAFLKTKILSDIKPGLIVDKQGNILGQHKGIAYYTIGQRQGLGIAKGYPLYVTKIDSKSNQITVGKREDAYKREFLVRDLSFIIQPIKKEIALRVKIRYNHPQALALVMPEVTKIKVCFKKPQFAITPGQAAVFYDQDKVLGGGIIDKVLD
jgi:tRNA-specific 2-thiouridylase